MLYVRIAVEMHIYTATGAERVQNSKHWILAANAEGGTQQSLNQRPDLAQARRECKRFHDEHLARTQQDYRDIPQKEDRFPRGRQIALMIYDCFRVTGAHDTVLDYSDLSSGTLRDHHVQEFDARWDELLLSMSKIQADDILESLHKLRIRESAQLKTVLELYDMEIHQKNRCPIIKN